MSSTNKDTIITMDIHCPYCNSEKAILIHRTESKKFSLQYPAYGLKAILSILYLSFLYMWVQGFKIIEIKRESENVTYGFCPNCGNGYSMAPPESVKEENEEPRFYKIREGKKIMGLCKGISEYTNIPLVWIRIMTALWGLTIIGTVFYFIIGICIPFKDEEPMFYRIRDGKFLMGVCKGISEYTGLSIVLVRIITFLFGPVVYFLLGFSIPYADEINHNVTSTKEA